MIRTGRRGRGTDRAEWMTESALQTLKAGWFDGETTAAIGRRLGVSKNAIIGKAGRMGLPERPSPIKHGGPTVVAAVRAQPPTIPPLASEQDTPKPANASPDVAASPALPRPLPRPVIAAPKPPPPRPVFVRPPVACCWLSGDRPYRQCEALAVGKLPYCEAHAAKAYSSAGWRQREAAGSHTSMGGDN